MEQTNSEYYGPSVNPIDYAETNIRGTIMLSDYEEQVLPFGCNVILQVPAKTVDDIADKGVYRGRKLTAHEMSVLNFSSHPMIKLWFVNTAYEFQFFDGDAFYFEEDPEHLGPGKYQQLLGLAKNKSKDWIKEGPALMNATPDGRIDQVFLSSEIHAKNHAEGGFKTESSFFREYPNRGSESDIRDFFEFFEKEIDTIVKEVLPKNCWKTGKAHCKILIKEEEETAEMRFDFMFSKQSGENPAYKPFDYAFNRDCTLGTSFPYDDAMTELISIMGRGVGYEVTNSQIPLQVGIASRVIERAFELYEIDVRQFPFRIVSQDWQIDYHNVIETLNGMAFVRTFGHGEINHLDKMVKRFGEIESKSGVYIYHFLHPTSSISPRIGFMIHFVAYKDKPVTGALNYKFGYYQYYGGVLGLRCPEFYLTFMWNQAMACGKIDRWWAEVTKHNFEVASTGHGHLKSQVCN